MSNLTQPAPYADVAAKTVGDLARRALVVSGVRPGSRPLHDFEQVPPPAGPPGKAARQGELRGALQLPRLLLATPRLAAAPRGDGSVVVDVPGWRAPEWSGAPLRTYLRWLGYHSSGWGLGINRGDPERDAELMTAKVIELAQRSGRPVALTGWSLGGVIAREVARQAPDAVRCVVTFGTPVVGGPTHTLGAGTYGPDECARVSRLIEQLDAEAPIAVPLTAILTRQDGVVAWAACVDRSSPRVRHVEVHSTHLGLGIDPDVWLSVARALAGQLPAVDGHS